MSFIPNFHFEAASEKLKPEWCDQVVQYYLRQSNLPHLLADKKVSEIEGYATGNFSLNPYKKLFKSLRKQMAAHKDPNTPQEYSDNLDTTGILWECLALIPPKLNAARSTISKIPFEVTCTCQDPLAQKKKNEDLEFIRNIDKMKEVLQPMYDSMNLGDVDLGETKYSSVPFKKMPMDLDVNNDDEFKIFAELIYNLAPETAFETVLQMFYDFKKVPQIKLLEIIDQLKFGISLHSVMDDKNTDLPNIEYTHPERVRAHKSHLPDYSDNVIRTIDYSVTPFELFKYFPDEICDEDFLYQIVNGNPRDIEGWGHGYCPCNNFSIQISKNWGTFKMNLVKVEVKSVDSAMIAQKKKAKYGEFRYFTNDEKKCVEKVWGQNTYSFFWLQNTKWYFGIDRLGFAYRTKGKETYTNFTTNIYKSQEKSAVELCIGENKKAQIADVKLQHSIIMSKPAGQVIDLKYVRNAVEGLSDDVDKYSVKELVEQASEKNIHIIDSDGFEGRQGSSQYLPVRDLPGGLKDEITGYYRVQFEARQNISIITGINDALTGAGINPEGLVGLQKLQINQSINAIYYINEAMIAQYTSLFNTWAYYITQSIKRGGEGKQAILNLIGSRKVDTIKGIDEVPLHQIGIKITLGQREEERAVFKMEVQKLRQAGVLNAADEYFILNTSNPKDALWMIAVKENKFQKKQEQRQQAQLQSLQQMKETEGQNMLANTQAQTEGKLKQIGVEKQGDAMLLELGNKLGLTSIQISGLIKRQLQRERISDQTDKSLKTISANKNAEAQQPILQ